MNDDFTVWRAFALAAQFGVTLGIWTGIGVFGGRWLDERFHAAPLFTIVCIFVGLVVGAVSGVQLIRFSLRRQTT